MHNRFDFQHPAAGKQPLCTLDLYLMSLRRLHDRLLGELERVNKWMQGLNPRKAATQEIKQRFKQDLDRLEAGLKAVRNGLDLVDEPNLLEKTPARRPERHKSAGGRPEPETKKILFIDDDSTVNKIYSHFFQKENFRIFCAPNGKEGLETARREKPDIIIVDIMMPVMNGYEFLSRKNEDKSIAGIPAILVSTLSEEDQILKGLQAGAVDYITKPFSMPVLMAKTKKILNLSDDHASDSE